MRQRGLCSESRGFTVGQGSNKKWCLLLIPWPTVLFNVNCNNSVEERWLNSDPSGIKIYYTQSGKEPHPSRCWQKVKGARNRRGKAARVTNLIPWRVTEEKNVALCFMFLLLILVNISSGWHYSWCIIKMTSPCNDAVTCVTSCNPFSGDMKFSFRWRTREDTEVQKSWAVLGIFYFPL